MLAVIVARDTCSGTGIEAAPSAGAKRGMPVRYLNLYRQAAGVPWPAVAAIDALDGDHGRSRAPPVCARASNSHGCCAGRCSSTRATGRPSTWERYGVDGNHDGTRDIYDPEDAIP